MRSMAPTEINTPPPNADNRCLMESTSFRKFFLLDPFKFDLSIASISYNLCSKTFASADSIDLETTEEDDVSSVEAFDWNGFNVNDKHVAIKQKAVFFILFWFLVLFEFI